MAELDYAQDYAIEAIPSQTYEFENGVPDYVGLLLAFSVGDETLDVDIPVVNPEEPDSSKTIKVCAILTQLTWNLKVGKTLYLQGRVSSNNRAKLLRSNIQEKQGTKTKFKFVWAQYHEPGNNYFKHFHTNDEEIEGEIDKAAPIWIASKPATDITQFRNFDFSLGIKGVDTKDQNLHIAATPTDKDVIAYSRVRQA